MHVEIRSKTSSNPRDYKGKMFAEQEAALHYGADYPLPFRINIEQGKEFEPGKYELDGSGFSTDKFRNLKLDRVKLKPYVAAK